MYTQAGTGRITSTAPTGDMIPSTTIPTGVPTGTMTDTGTPEGAPGLWSAAITKGDRLTGGVDWQMPVGQVTAVVQAEPIRGAGPIVPEH